MGLAEKILSKLKKEQSKTYTEKDIEEIKKKAVDDYLNSKEFTDEIDKVVKTLGDEWYKEYKKENESVNDKNETIEEMLGKNKDQEEYEKFLQENYVEGYGKEPEIVERIRLAKESRKVS